MSRRSSRLIPSLAIAALALGAPGAMAQQMGPGQMMQGQMEPGQTPGPMQPGQMMQGQTPEQMQEQMQGQMPGQMQPRGPSMGMSDASTQRRPGPRRQHADRRFQRRMEILDTSGDGKLSLNEITSEERRLFAAADVNGDGKLSVDEFRRRGRWFMRLRTMTFFDMLDTNGDGVISAAEITNPTNRWFKRYDANKDGALEGTELETLRDVRGGGRLWRR